MAWVYIIQSERTNRFYIGFTTELPETRLQRHNSEYYEGKATSRDKPWKLFYTLECIDTQQALSIEAHIKRMKSRKYIENLATYPEISAKLLAQYSKKEDC